MLAIGAIILLAIDILMSRQTNKQNNSKNDIAEIQKYEVKIQEEIEETKERALWFCTVLDILIQNNHRRLYIINLKNKDSLYLLKETLGALGTAYKSDFSFPIINEFLNEGHLAKIKNDSLKLGFQYFSMTLIELKSVDDYLDNQYSTAIEPYFYNTINYVEVVHGGAVNSGLKTGGPTTNYEQFYDNLELWSIHPSKYVNLVLRD